MLTEGERQDRITGMHPVGAKTGLCVKATLPPCIGCILRWYASAIFSSCPPFSACVFAGMADECTKVLSQRDDLECRLVQAVDAASEVADLKEALETCKRRVQQLQAELAHRPDHNVVLHLQCSLEAAQQQISVLESQVATRGAGPHEDESVAQELTDARTMSCRVVELEQQLADRHQKAGRVDELELQLESALQKADRVDVLEQELVSAKQKDDCISELEAQLSAAATERACAKEAQAKETKESQPADGDKADLAMQLQEQILKVKNMEYDAALSAQLHKKDSVNLNNRILDLEVRPCCLSVLRSRCLAL